MKIDLQKTKKSILIDTHSIEIEDAVKNFSSTCDIYCLGMPNESIENLKEAIIKNDTEDDWTTCVPYFMLDMICNQIITRSKKMQEQCEKYNIKFFDTSGNRAEKIKEVIKQIEENTILK